jgi:hypothetical protein
LSTAVKRDMIQPTHPQQSPARVTHQASSS